MQFGQVRVRDVMHSWNEAVCVAKSASRAAIVDAVSRSTGFGVPVLDGNNRVVGAVWKADALVVIA